MTALDVTPEASLATAVSPAERRRYARIVTILSITALLELWMWRETSAGDFIFLAEGTPVDPDRIEFTYDGQNLGLICLLVIVVVLAAFAAAPMRRGSPVADAVRRGPLFMFLMVMVGLAFVVGFCAWAYTGATLGADFALRMTNPLEGTIQYATPLTLGALAGAMCERSGVINIAIEGQFVAGAFFASVAGTIAASTYVGLLGGIAAGVGLAALLALFAIRYMVNQIIVGVVLWLFAVGITGFLLDQIPDDRLEDLNSPPILEPKPLAGLSDLPVVGEALFDQNLLVYLMYLAVPIAWFALFKTRWGLRVRAVGEHPRAADTVGIAVRGMRWQAVLVGGIFAGLGGAYYTVGSNGAFDKDPSTGFGFIALAALIMGRWHPVGAFLASIFFGFAMAMADQLDTVEKIPGDLIGMTPYLATIIAVAGLLGGAAKPPAADGQPYEKA
ncbi:MAG TPA: ABC transporter permease [Nocardioidaceae bacterium]|nr:ABC transporter permease [Nocardioidaceae bacterium]